MGNIKKCCLCDKEITDNCAIICKDCTDKIMEDIKNDKVPDFVKENSFCSSLVLLGIIHNGLIKDEKQEEPKNCYVVVTKDYGASFTTETMERNVAMEYYDFIKLGNDTIAKELWEIPANGDKPNKIKNEGIVRIRQYKPFDEED